MKFVACPMMLALALLAPTADAAELPCGRTLFLGDSITYGGQYVEYFEAALRLEFPRSDFEVINLGLPSETVSGLSEPGHAGGQFPRPGLHERLERALAKTKPDVVIACYGMNDGIYYPFGAERFKKFQEGILRLREAALQTGARVVHVTPPVFDALPLRGRTLPAGLPEYRQPFEGYNGVLDRYSDWLLDGRNRGWEVADVHGPINRYLADQRKTNADFRLAGDGVHPNAQGHWLMAQALLRHFGARSWDREETPERAFASDRQKAMLELVQKRQRLLKDPWLTDVGHQRPGMGKGLPLAEAQRQGEDLARQIKALQAAQ